MVHRQNHSSFCPTGFDDNRNKTVLGFKLVELRQAPPWPAGGSHRKVAAEMGGCGSFGRGQSALALVNRSLGAIFKTASFASRHGTSCFAVSTWHHGEPILILSFARPLSATSRRVGPSGITVLILMCRACCTTPSRRVGPSGFKLFISTSHSSCFEFVSLAHRIVGRRVGPS